MTPQGLHSGYSNVPSLRSLVAIRFDRLDGLLEQVVAASRDTRDRPRDRDGRLDADAVMARAVVLEHFHPRPDDAVPAGQRDRVDIAVGPGRRPAHERAELLVLDDPQA